MKYYQEITLCPGSEINNYFLWQKIFQKIHLCFVNLKDSNGIIPIGISFPEYNNNKNPELGSKLRFFSASENTLKELNLKHKFNYFFDYIHLTNIRRVLDKCIYAKYWRKQPKSSVARLARRKAKRENISFDKALEQLKGFNEQKIKTPYINIDSQSSGQKFRLFIIKDVVEKPIEGGFNCYGLSLKTTVPEF